MGGGVSGKFGNTRGARLVALLAENGYHENGEYQKIVSDALSMTEQLATAAKKKNKEQILEFTKEAENATFDKKLDTKEGQILVFDGRSFSLYENGAFKKSWDAVSGKKGYQTKEFQYEKGRGPIPDGVYAIRQGEESHQHIDTKSNIKGMASSILTFGKLKLGAWPGGEAAWGKHRVWITPANETDTKGRDKFSVHGGWEPGSIGCIDLTSGMDDFNDWFTKNKKDVRIRVKHKY